MKQDQKIREKAYSNQEAEGLMSDTQLNKYIYFKKHFYNIKMMQTGNHLNIMKVEHIHPMEYRSTHQYNFSFVKRFSSLKLHILF